MASKKDLIDGQKILLVDDEPDILEALEELLPACDITTATSFEEGKEFLEGKEFDWQSWTSWVLEETLKAPHVAEAIQYRALDRKMLR
ncbi:MAG: hypothetical protein H8E10_20705 [Desulfobacterales bacterium]|nr:hypothetical protein [Desulfobacterales bacterium]